MDYPFSRSILWIAPWGYLLGATMAIVVAMGMLLIYFSHSKKKLKESENRFRSLLDQAADAMFVHDIEGQVIDINKKSCESLGYTRKELLTMSVKDIDAEFISQNHVTSFWNKLTPEKPVTLEGVHKRWDNVSGRSTTGGAPFG